MVKQPRMYVVKKYIRAISAMDAIRLEKDVSVDEVGIDCNWRDYYLSEQMGLEDLARFDEKDGSA